MKKTNKKFIIILAAVALLAVGGIAILNRNKDLISAESVRALEPAVARIDISTTPYTDEAQFVIYDEHEQPLKEYLPMTNWGSRGYVLQKEGNNDTFSIKANKNVDIHFVLRGKWEKGLEGDNVAHWVDFTSITINNEEILSEKTAVWHDKPFKHVIHAKAGETYHIFAKWQKHEENVE